MLLMLAGFAVSQFSLEADEPVKLTLSSRPTLPLTITNTVKTTEKSAVVATNSRSVSERATKAKLPAKTTLSPIADLQSAASTVVIITKKPEPVGLFSTQSGNGSFGFANIEAGYGQVYDNDSAVLRGRNGTAWEETRYVFFKKSVKF